MARLLRDHGFIGTTTAAALAFSATRVARARLKTRFNLGSKSGVYALKGGNSSKDDEISLGREDTLVQG